MVLRPAPSIRGLMANRSTLHAIFVAEICCFTLLMVSCAGGGAGSTTPPQPNFTLTVSPGSVLVSQGSTSMPVELSSRQPFSSQSNDYKLQ